MKHPAGCPETVERWILGSPRQRTIRWHCIDCAMELMSTGKWLMLAHSKKD